MPDIRPVCSATVLALAMAAAPLAARAHGAGLSYLDLTVKDGVVEAALDVPAEDLEKALHVDADGDGLLEAEDVATAGAALSQWLVASVRLVADGRVCAGGPAASVLRDNALVTVRATYRCEGRADRLDVASRLLDTFGEGHSTYVRAARGGTTAQELLTSRNTLATLALGGGGGALDAAGRFLLLGIEHIFLGLDHVLFLLALLLLGGPLRRVVAIVTAFTAAHTITLSLAALGLFDLPSRFVESAIALSIGYVAVEDWVHSAPLREGAKEPIAVRLRWVVTFAFGLVHGFGFAGVLRELGLPEDHLPVALASFNVGVELGQVAIVLVAYPLLVRAARTSWYRPRGIQVASLGLFGAAVYWFVERAFG